MQRNIILTIIGALSAVVAITIMRASFNQVTIPQAIIIGLGIGLGLIIILSLGRSIIRTN